MDLEEKDAGSAKGKVENDGKSKNPRIIEHIDVQLKVFITIQGSLFNIFYYKMLNFCF